MIQSNPTLAERPYTYELVTRISPILQGIYNAYKLVMIPLVLLAVLAFLYRMIVQIQRKKLDVIWMMSAMIIVLFTSRLALLAFMRTTLFDSNELRYMSPLHPLVIIFIVFNCYEIIFDIVNKLKKVPPAKTG